MKSALFGIGIVAGLAALFFLGMKMGRDTERSQCAKEQYREVAVHLVVTNTGPFTVVFPDFPRGSGKWATNANELIQAMKDAPTNYIISIEDIIPERHRKLTNMLKGTK